MSLYVPERFDIWFVVDFGGAGGRFVLIGDERPRGTFLVCKITKREKLDRPHVAILEDDDDFEATGLEYDSYLLPLDYETVQRDELKMYCGFLGTSYIQALKAVLTSRRREDQ